MNLLAPVALLLGLLAVPILLLYMLKLRRRETPVSSTLLWQQVLLDKQANTPWQRLKRNLLLFLQLLILAALVLALARPAQPVPSVASGAALILLDGSASMNSTDVSPTRFEAARAAALELVNNLPGRTPVTLILAGVQPRLLTSAETDPVALRSALQAARVDGGSADWPAAFALAVGAANAAQSDPNNPLTVVLISDGGLPAEGLPALPGTVRYIPIGSSGDNLAITALAVRPADQGAEAFTSVHNYSDQPRRAILSFYAGEQLFDAQTVEIAAGESREVVLRGLPGTPQQYTARLSTTASSGEALDALALDDSAFAAYRPASSGKALLVSTGNLFLKQLLQSMAGVQASVVLPGEDGKVQLPAGTSDLYIFDGILPETLPSGNLLLINPPPNALFEVTGTVTEFGKMTVADHPVTRYVDWDNVHILQARQMTLPAWGEVLVSSVSTPGGDAPLVFIGETGTGSERRRVAVVTFDLHDSDLPLQITFPILFSNLFQYFVQSSNLAAVDTNAENTALAGQPATAASSGLQIRPGVGVLIRPPEDVSEIVVTAPDGSQQRLRPEEGQAIYNQSAQPGLYSVSYAGHDEIAADAFAVNLFSVEESNIQPRPDLQLGQTRVAPAAQEAVGQREWWPWLAALALLILLVEWWIYHRRQSVLVGVRLPRILARRKAASRREA